jgi:hypothetical protein
VEAFEDPSLFDLPLGSISGIRALRDFVGPLGGPLFNLWRSGGRWLAGDARCQRRASNVAEWSGERFRSFFLRSLLLAGYQGELRDILYFLSCLSSECLVLCLVLFPSAALGEPYHR